jgi:hypothetical protein
MFLTVFIACLYAFSFELADSLFRKPIIEHPFDLTIAPVSSDSNIVDVVMIETPDDSLWFFVGNQVWQLQRNPFKWKLLGEIEFSETQQVGAYDPYSKEFLFWSSSVGRVYTWKPGMNAPIRLDKSDLHRTQFSHYSFVDPNTGNVYAFGGGGYWQTRGYISKYDRLIKEWSIVPINSERYPPPRMASRGAYDTVNHQLHIFGGYDYRFSRADLSTETVALGDYWVFDFKSSTWEEKKLFNKPRNHDIYLGAYQHQYPSISNIDIENRLIWYLMNTDVDVSLQLVVFDIERDFGAYLPVYFPSVPFVQLEYDEDNNRLFVYQQTEQSGNKNNVINKILSYDVPSASEVRRVLDELRTKDENRTTSLTGNVNVVLLLMLPFLFISFWFFMYRRKQLKSKGQSATSLPNIQYKLDANHLSTDSVNLKVSFTDTVGVWINDKKINHLFSLKELELFLWLFWKSQIGKLYQSTDVIEDLFWVDIQNPDYVRKQRNLSLKRLNTQLNEFFAGTIKREDWIVDRNAYNDKRKKEYALHLDNVNITFDLDKMNSPETDVLPGYSGKWVDDIRSEYTIWSHS